MGRVTASGGAAPGMQNIGVSDVNTLDSVNNALEGGQSGGLGLGSIAPVGGLISGLSQGGAQGGLRAAGSAGQLYNQITGNTGGFAGLLGTAGSALNIYNGLTSGNAAGKAGAAVGAAQLASKAGAFGGASGAIGNAAGYAAIPLSLYNEINNWQSGATGQDALGGASTGAAIGTAVLPGIGTAVGALLGGAAGALSSVFGNGKVDPENQSFEGYTQQFNKTDPTQQKQLASQVQNPYLPLAGMFDLRSNQIKGTIPMYNQYGRMGEQKFANDLINKVQSTVKPGESVKDEFTNSVQPWLQGMGNWNDSNKNAMMDLMEQMTSQVMDGSYKSNWKSIGGETPWGTPAVTPAPTRGSGRFL